MEIWKIPRIWRQTAQDKVVVSQFLKIMPMTLTSETKVTCKNIGSTIAPLVTYRQPKIILCILWVSRKRHFIFRTNGGKVSQVDSGPKKPFGGCGRNKCRRTMKMPSGAEWSGICYLNLFVGSSWAEAKELYLGSFFQRNKSSPGKEGSTITSPEPRFQVFGLQQISAPHLPASAPLASILLGNI